MDLLIKLFGGFTLKEFNHEISRLDKTCFDKIQEIFKQTSEDKNYLKDLIVQKDIEIQRLTNLMLIEHGVIRPNVEIVKEDTPPKPFSSRGESMKERIIRKEKEDRDSNLKRIKALNPELNLTGLEGKKVDEDMKKDLELLS